MELLLPLIGLAISWFVIFTAVRAAIINATRVVDTEREAQAATRAARLAPPTTPPAE